MQIPQPKTPDINSPQLYIDLHKDENLSWGEAYERVEQNLYNVWKEKYGNITNMYDLDIYPTDSETTLKSGWALKIVSKIPDKFNVLTPVPGSGIQTFLLFPSKVAYKKVAPILQGSIPTVETAVEESLNFEINNEKSDLQPYYSRGSTYNLIKKMKRLVDNEYYYLEKDNIPLVSYYDRESYSNDEPFESGGMHNGYYEVTFKRTQPITYSINRVDKSVIQNEKYILMMIYIATATIAAIIVFMLTIKKR